MTQTYTRLVWHEFKKRKVSVTALAIFVFFFLVGLYAPFLTSSKPLLIKWEGAYYFPLLRYLFYRGFYTKGIDLFFNVLMFTLPIGVLGFLFLTGQQRTFFLYSIITLQLILFGFFYARVVKNPALKNALLVASFHENPNWSEEVEQMSTYTKINTLLFYRYQKRQHQRLLKYDPLFRQAYNRAMPTLWSVAQKNNGQNRDDAYFSEREAWLESENQNLHILIPPLLRSFHWEEDAGGSQTLNQFLPWWEVTRINRKDLVASLLFGIRVSMSVGLSVVALSFLFGILFGSLSGYFAGKTDLIICRIIEIWEAMPTFFMLLLIIAITQNKSIFLIITVLGIFGWTGIARFMRGEMLKQRNLPYVLACKSLGFKNGNIMFSQILPNAIPPILTLLPFSMMAAITSEAGISFLGLGEEGSTSWGILMDEGRAVFPGESYLLWPPAILLTILLISIALIGDRLRDCIDPKSV